MLDPAFFRAYRFFRERAGGQVGHSAEYAFALARAERWADKEGVEFVCEPEYESYRDVYGEDPPEGVDFSWLAVKVEGEVLASLGFVDDTNGYHRVVFAELALEAFAEVERRTDAAVARARALDPQSAVAAGW
jgi:hypothetical protein